MAKVAAPLLGKQGKADLPEAVFAEPFHQSLLHEVATADMAARRRGTASTLGRGEVAMTGAKAFRQKGTGRARAGALSVSQRRGGGITFGPTPRSFVVKVNRKARRRALRSALSLHAGRGSLAVLDASVFDSPSTKGAAKALAGWGEAGPTLVVLAKGEDFASLSFRNLERVKVVDAAQANVADIVAAASLVVSQGALETLEARAGDVKRPEGRAVEIKAPKPRKPKRTRRKAKPKAEQPDEDEAGEAPGDDAPADETSTEDEAPADETSTEDADTGEEAE